VEANDLAGKHSEKSLIFWKESFRFRVKEKSLIFIPKRSYFLKSPYSLGSKFFYLFIYLFIYFYLFRKIPVLKVVNVSSTCSKVPILQYIYCFIIIYFSLLVPIL
jgi:hypothetical protein